MKGRPPVPSTIKILNGNPGRRPLNADEPVARPLKRMPSPPEYFNPLAREAWFREGRRLMRAGLLSETDLSMFTTWCLFAAVRAEAAGALNKTGLVVRAGDAGNPYLSPYLNALSMAAKAMHQIEVEFGQSPASRSRVRSLNPSQGLLFPDLLGDDIEDAEYAS
jgi:P27 family predicted phage terminase small subunit